MTDLAPKTPYRRLRNARSLSLSDPASLNLFSATDFSKFSENVEDKVKNENNVDMEADLKMSGKKQKTKQNEDISMEMTNNSDNSDISNVKEAVSTKVRLEHIYIYILHLIILSSHKFKSRYRVYTEQGPAYIYLYIYIY